ncbi:MAG: hypothetical protein ACE5HQ_01510 [Gemmatimonadota bacterium]
MLIALGVAVGYAAIIVIRSEVDFRSVRETAQQQLRLGEGRGDEEIRAAVLARVRELGLPRQAERIGLMHLPRGEIRLSLQYSDTLVFADRWRWIRPRRIDVRHRP